MLEEVACMGLLSPGRWSSWASSSTGEGQGEPGVGQLWFSAHSIITSLVLQGPLSISASQGLRTALFGGLALLPSVEDREVQGEYRPCGRPGGGWLPVG